MVEAMDSLCDIEELLDNCHVACAEAVYTHTLGLATSNAPRARKPHTLIYPMSLASTYMYVPLGLSP